MPDESALLDLEVSSPPFAYNASTWSQRIPVCVLASIGCVTATYMGL